MVLLSNLFTGSTAELRLTTSACSTNGRLVEFHTFRGKMNRYSGQEVSLPFIGVSSVPQHDTNRLVIAGIEIVWRNSQHGATRLVLSGKLQHTFSAPVSYLLAS